MRGGQRATGWVSVSSLMSTLSGQSMAEVSNVAGRCESGWEALRWRRCAASRHDLQNMEPFELMERMLKRHRWILQIVLGKGGFAGFRSGKSLENCSWSTARLQPVRSALIGRMGLEASETTAEHAENAWSAS